MIFAPGPDEWDAFVEAQRAADRAELLRVVGALAFIVTLCTLAFLIGVTS